MQLDLKAKLKMSSGALPSAKCQVLLATIMTVNVNRNDKFKKNCNLYIYDSQKRMKLQCLRKKLRPTANGWCQCSGLSGVRVQIFEMWSILIYTNSLLSRQNADAINVANQLES